jgi:hypothetical protein
MTKILIEGKNIKRNICMEFDINTKISYEKFCKDEHHLQIFDKAKEEHRFALVSQIIIDYLDFNSRISEHITKKLALLLSNDISETFEN